MIVYAAIDMKGGRVVQLIGGHPERERLSLSDAIATTGRFVAAGFEALHVVDLDAALGDGSNRAKIRAIIDAANVPVQVGGGVRDLVAVADWLADGASRVIVGTRAVTDLPWLAKATEIYPDRIVVAADVRDGEVVTHGWKRSSGSMVEAFLAAIEALPLAGALITDVGREGSLSAVDADLFARLSSGTTLPIVAAGGIGDIDDLRALADTSVSGAVVGTALYTGAIDPSAAAREFQN